MRSRLLLASALAIVVASALTGCASIDPGPTVTQARVITDVSAVELDTSGDLTVTLGATPSLTVIAGERIIDRLTADIDGGVLRLGMDGDGMLRSGEIRYELTVSSLESMTVLGSGDAVADFSGATAPTITVRGSGDVEATGLRAAEAVLTIDGSGAIAVRDAAVADLRVRIDGSGGVAIDGTADAQHVEIHGDGGYEAAGLRSTDAVVAIAGAGGAAVTADGTLDATIDGSGDIEYGGHPRVTEDVSGSGDVMRR
ncbi:DUF2807 domain-containing protein [Microbacterium sp. K24]|uniref:GIN domain-containing protein n=1 Tax=Microbacterium sp. K24 TaxID=2305446 RepID=UPI00109C9896|nr:DUF2807 domain-containing protein [Microbacterium sp. K24]